MEINSLPYKMKRADCVAIKERRRELDETTRNIIYIPIKFGCHALVTIPTSKYSELMIQTKLSCKAFDLIHYIAEVKLLMEFHGE